MVGVGLMMGGLSLGELKGAIASRPSKNTDDDDDGANDANRKIGVRVVPASSSTPVAPNVAGGKPAWMLELEAKKRAKAASERHMGDTRGVCDDATTASRRRRRISRISHLNQATGPSLIRRLVPAWARRSP